jgi:hypothetical protein
MDYSLLLYHEVKNIRISAEYYLRTSKTGGEMASEMAARDQPSPSSTSACGRNGSQEVLLPIYVSISFWKATYLSHFLVLSRSPPPFFFFGIVFVFWWYLIERYGTRSSVYD